MTGPKPNKAVQRIFLSLLPARWGESLHRASQDWTITCPSCGYPISVWDAGGIRWGAKSTGKRTFGKCPSCGGKVRFRYEHSKK